VAFASIRDKFRQQRNEQASRKLSHRLVVGPDTRRASNVLISTTTPGKGPNTMTGVGNNDTSTSKPVDSTSSSSTTTSSPGAGVGIEFVVSDLTVTAQRLEQV